MKLERVSLRNFRSHWSTTLEIDSLTALVGRNDAGKSTILEALAIFFELRGAKPDIHDLTKGADDPVLEVRCTFSDLPALLVMDDGSETTLAGESLLNAKGHLEIVKRWRFGGKTQADVYAYARHPIDDGIGDLLEVKIEELRARAERRGLSVEDGRRALSFRRALLDAVPQKTYMERLVPFREGDGRKLWQKIERELPSFVLFKADRATSDEDAEAQDPMVAAVRQALKEVDDDLRRISRRVKDKIEAVGQRTIEELRKIDEALASELRAEFKAEPKWESLFKLSLIAENEIPLNKRGSGVKRLVLLSFLLAEAQRRRQEEQEAIIFAIEEPETALHPTQQRLLVDTLRRLSETPSTQIVVTTHAPPLAGLLPYKSLRLVSREGERAMAKVSNDAPEKIATELGVFAHVDPTKLRLAILVEGPTDVAFLTRACKVLREGDAFFPDLSGDDRRFLLLPVGGGTLTHWVENRYLRGLKVPELHVYDRDQGVPPKYQAMVDQVNARTDGSRAHLTICRELENYYHASAIEASFGIRVTFNKTSDVTTIVAKAIYEKHEREKRGLSWEDLDSEVQADRKRAAKTSLAKKVLHKMTAGHFVETGFRDELRMWLTSVWAAVEA